MYSRHASSEWCRAHDDCYPELPGGVPRLGWCTGHHARHRGTESLWWGAEFPPCRCAESPLVFIPGVSRRWREGHELTLELFRALREGGTRECLRLMDVLEEITGVGGPRRAGVLRACMRNAEGFPHPRRVGLADLLVMRTDCAVLGWRLRELGLPDAALEAFHWGEAADTARLIEQASGWGPPPVGFWARALEHCMFHVWPELVVRALQNGGRRSDITRAFARRPCDGRYLVRDPSGDWDDYFIHPCGYGACATTV